MTVVLLVATVVAGLVIGLGLGYLIALRRTAAVLAKLSEEQMNLLAAAVRARRADAPAG